MKNILLFIIITTNLFVSSCVQGQSEKNLTNKNWYYFDEDSFYFEIYIDESKITICDEIIPNCLTFDCILDSNKVFVYDKDSLISTICFDNLKSDQSKIKIYNNWYNVQSLDKKIDFSFENCSNKFFYDEFMEKFINRARKLKTNR